jgi:hypothetical protein
MAALIQNYFLITFGFWCKVHTKPSQSFFPTSLMKIDLGKHNFGKTMDFAKFEEI